MTDESELGLHQRVTENKIRQYVALDTIQAKTQRKALRLWKGVGLLSGPMGKAIWKTWSLVKAAR